MTNDELYRIDHDLSSALEHNSVVLPSPVDAILATIGGEYDGSDWHWLVRLEGGDYAYITGGCDYTGWD